MRTLAIAALACLALAGCGPNAQQRQAAFLPTCQRHDFTLAQCDLLFSMSEAAKDESDNASTLGAVAIGLSAGSSGGRR